MNDEVRRSQEATAIQGLDIYTPPQTTVLP